MPWTAGPNLPRLGCSALRQMQRPGVQARPAFPRRSVRFRADGATSPLHRGRAGPGCRSFHAAPLCGAGRERAPADLRTHEGGVGQRRRRAAPNWATLQTSLLRACAAGRSRSLLPMSSRRIFCRSSMQSEELARPRSKRSRGRSMTVAFGPREVRAGTRRQ